MPGRDRRVLSLRFRRVSFLFRVACGKNTRTVVGMRPTPCLRRARPAIRQLGPHMIRARDGRARAAGGRARDGLGGTAQPVSTQTTATPVSSRRRRFIRIRFQSLESRLAVGQLPRFAAGCVQAWSRGRWLGARSPAHARGAPFSVRRRCAINSVCSCDGCGHREWCLRPCPKPPARAPGWAAKAWHATADASGWWWCPRAQAQFAVAPHDCRAERC